MFRCVFVLCCCTCFGQLSGSAIPMWEFLSKEEKMSFLYSIFANLVEDFCETSKLKDCNRELLKYGLATLKNTQESHLDHMDPYQKGSHYIIWAGMLQGNTLATSPLKEQPSTTPTANSYDDDKIDTLVGAATGDLDNVYRLPPPPGFKIEKYDYPPNVAALIEAANASEDEKGEFLKFQELFFNDSNSTGWRPLNGPVVIKVYPDGTPVDEVVPEHHDEDLRQHLLAQVPIPESI